MLRTLAYWALSELHHNNRRKVRMLALTKLPDFISTNEKLFPLLQLANTVFSGMSWTWGMRTFAFSKYRAQVDSILGEIHASNHPRKNALAKKIRTLEPWRIYEITKLERVREDLTGKKFIYPKLTREEAFGTPIPELRIGKNLLKTNVEDAKKRVIQYQVDESIEKNKQRLLWHYDLILQYAEEEGLFLNIHALERFILMSAFCSDLENYHRTLVLKNENIRKTKRAERSNRTRKIEAISIRPENPDLTQEEEGNETKITDKIAKISVRIDSIVNRTSNSERSKLLEEIEEMRSRLDSFAYETKSEATKTKIHEVREKIHLATSKILNPKDFAVHGASKDIPTRSLEETRAPSEIEKSISSMLEELLSTIKNVSSTKLNGESFADGNVNNQVIRPLVRFALSYMEQHPLEASGFSWKEVIKNYPKERNSNGTRMIGALAGYANFSATNDPAIVLDQLIKAIEKYTTSWNHERDVLPCTVLIGKMREFAQVERKRQVECV